jgi:anti-anti-sigma factor
MDFHADFITREAFLLSYLRRCITPEIANEFEAHLFECDECLTELRATELLAEALAQPTVETRHAGDVLIVDFTCPVELIAGSREYEELGLLIGESGDKRVLIDLNRVSRIDSAGLGMLMRYYCRAARRTGFLRVMRPNTHVRRLLDVTHLGPLLEMYSDEGQVLETLGGA